MTAIPEDIEITNSDDEDINDYKKNPLLREKYPLEIVN